MLTRLSVSGFKNLVDTQVSFGPFTCIAGANGVGKSNLFDAIQFLSNLATYSLQEAGAKVRDESGRAGDLKSLFSRTGDTYADIMAFEAEMIIPPNGLDDLGQRAEAQITFLRYRLELSYEEESTISTMGRLVIRKEELTPISIGDAHGKLGFLHRPDWRNSVVNGRRTSPFISTTDGPAGAIIQRHQVGNQGRTWQYIASTLPRTLLSNINSSESSTAVLAKHELQSWRLLQMEPSALRQPDSIDSASHLTSNGLHLPATLYRMARQGADSVETDAQYARISNRLAEMNEDVRRVMIERDDKRALLTLQVEDRGGTRHSARALSDGTLRFLALTVIEEDTQLGGVLCLEEPENGIHPERIQAMIRLLQDISTDPMEPVGPDNPLRQVIINTHSPVVVQVVPDDSLVVAERVMMAGANKKATSSVQFSALADTWRTKNERSLPTVQKGKLLAYLGGAGLVDIAEESAADTERRPQPKRVIDRSDMQMQFKLFAADDES